MQFLFQSKPKIHTLYLVEVLIVSLTQLVNITCIRTYTFFAVL
jgi:hypothetical protein